VDLTESIAPKSDQLNAEDLLTGPRTFTVAEVRQGSAEQPVDVHLVEFPGRPFKPSKTVRRIMVAAWGKDSAAYAGRRLTLYRDPTVRFGGQDVGGIRVSHMSHIEKRIVLALTVTRGKRAPYTVEPLTERAGPPLPLIDALAAIGITDKDRGLEYIGRVIGRQITKTTDLTSDETAKVIAAATQDAAELPLDPS
jgi:hypothetical protein